VLLNINILKFNLKYVTRVLFQFLYVS